MSLVKLVRLGVAVGSLAGVSACGSTSSNVAKAPTAGSGGLSGVGSGGTMSMTGAAGTFGQPGQTKGVAVIPADARVNYNGKLQFKALAMGATDQGVAWSIQEGLPGGAIDGTGRYTAPGNPGVFHIIAISNANSMMTGSARVTVSASPGTPPVLQAGVWTDLTPSTAGLRCCPESGGNSYGVLFVEIDPGDPNVLYTGIDSLGIWKSTDRGSTWRGLGTKGQVMSNTQTTFIDTPIRLAVDPHDSNHLYATSGVHGNTLGFWVSKDGGDNWSIPRGFVDIAATTTFDVTLMSVDAADFNHVVVASHSPWVGLSNAGILETKDGGASWVAHAPAAWNAGTVGISILYSPSLGIGDSKTWLVGTDGAGLWRTADSGASWTKVSDNGVPHGGHEIYYSPAGGLYAGATPYPMRSLDNGVTWEQLTSGLSFSYYYLVYGDGKRLYTSPAYTGTNGGSPQPFFSTAESGGKAWTPDQGGQQKMVDGPYEMRFDSANSIMYAASWGAGLLALKVPSP